MQPLDTGLRRSGLATVRAARQYVSSLVVAGMVGALTILPTAAWAGADQPPGVGGMLWTWQQTQRFVATEQGGADQPPDAAAASAVLDGTPWTLVEYVGPDGSARPVLPGTAVTASFQGGRLAGSAGCNSYSAAYALNGSAIEISPAISTRMACAAPPGIMAQEGAYLAALATARVYRIEGSRLILETTDGARVASFVPATESAALGGVVI